MVEQGQTLGEFLRQAREQRGITIEQVASATKIGVRLLHSLEADHYADLPAKPFIRGFVTSYARFVGLDPKEILTRYGDFLEDRSLDRPNRESGHSGYAFEKKESEQSRTVLGVVMGGFVVLGGLLIFVFKPSLHHHRGSHLEKLRSAHEFAPQATPSSEAASAVEKLSAQLPANSTAQAAPSPSSKPEALGLAAGAPASAQPSSAPSAAATSKAESQKSVLAQAEPSPLSSPAPQASPEVKLDRLNSGAGLLPQEIKHKVVFKAMANLWVRYQVDDRPMMKFILGKGKLLVLRAVKRIFIQLSNPKSITYIYNGVRNEGDKVQGNIVMRQNNATLYFPPKEAKANEAPFPGEKPLPSTPDPVVDNLPPTPAPSP